MYLKAHLLGRNYIELGYRFKYYFTRLWYVFELMTYNYKTKGKED